MASNNGTERRPAPASTGGDRSLPVLNDQRLDLHRALEDLLRCPEWGTCFSKTCLCPAFLLLIRRYLRKKFPVLRNDDARLENVVWDVQKRFRTSSKPIRYILGFVVTVTKRIIIDQTRHEIVVRRSTERMLSNKGKVLAAGIQPAVHHVSTDAKDLLGWLEPQVDPMVWRAISLSMGECRSSREVAALMEISHTSVLELVDSGLEQCRQLLAGKDPGANLAWICS